MNINDIAKLAGVSRATVSRYLNGGYVSAEKKEKIGGVIKETGYKPSYQAQMLRTKKTGIIGVILPKINSDAISRMVEGISVVLKKAGYQLLMANTQNDEKEELNYLNTLKNYHVDGIILIGTVMTREHKALLKNLEIPLVVLAQKWQGCACVYYDDYHSALEVTECMLKKGRHPGYIGVFMKDQAAGAQRRKGFQEACRRNHVECPEEHMTVADFTVESGYKSAKKLFEKSPEIDALFCATDQIAYGAALYLKKIGKGIPEDVQIVGIGDSVIGRMMEPPLTTVHYFYKTSGIEAANMLIGMVEEKAEAIKEIKMGYRLEKRDSVKK